MITGCGMYLSSVPIRSTPAAINMTPASNVHRISPPYPNLSMTLNTTGTKAAVGPPICTREPPRSDMRKPATIAVYRPFSGVVPEATASAIASGRATIETVRPASRSARKSPVVYPRRRTVTSFGT